MKYIEKGDEPEDFRAWKALANESWRPTYADLRGTEKKAVKKSLMTEQGYICCYCERRLLDGDSHIEHLLPQSEPAVDPLDYANMLCSCQNKLDKGEPRHCGNLKEDAQLEISPFDVSCADNFSFTHDGKIQAFPADNSAAHNTIALLDLDIPKLNDMRKKAIEPFLDPALDADDLSRFVAGYLDTNLDEFGEFWTTINYLFGDATG